MAKTLGRSAAFVALWRALTAARRGGPGIGRRLAALPRMVKATVTGRYDGGWRLALMALGVVYLVSPIDALPELALLAVGLIDDAVVVTWLAGAVLSETDRFLAWEAQRAKVIEGKAR